MYRDMSGGEGGKEKGRGEERGRDKGEEVDRGGGTHD